MKVFLPKITQYFLFTLSPLQRGLFLAGAGIVITSCGVAAGVFVLSHSQSASSLAFAERYPSSAVLAAETEAPDFEFNVNVPSNFAGNSIFSKDVTVKGNLQVKGKAVFAEGLSLSGQEGYLSANAREEADCE